MNEKEDVRSDPATRCPSTNRRRTPRNEDYSPYVVADTLPSLDLRVFQGGVVIDMSRFNEVTPAEDGKSIVVGFGARWMDVSRVNDQKGLAVLCGRNSAVGVGGLTLGGGPLDGPFQANATPGGLSFLSPRYGLVCSNVICDEIVLASGTITTASATTNSDLWRPLKGGSNNFGVVTRFTFRCFPCG